MESSDSEEISTEEFNRRQDAAAAAEDARSDAREAASRGVMRFIEVKAGVSGGTTVSAGNDDDTISTISIGGDADDEDEDVDDDEHGDDNEDEDDGDNDSDAEDDDGDDEEKEEGEVDDNGVEENKDSDDQDIDVDTDDMADEAEYCVDLDYLRQTIRRIRERLIERELTVMNLRRTMNRCESCRNHTGQSIVIDLCSTTDDDEGNNGDPFKTPERRPSKTYVPRAP